MTEATLESPDSASDLFLAAEISDVEARRPILTGDVFAGVQIPGLETPSLAIVITHPCSMRRDGVRLADRLLMAEVREHQHIPLAAWSTGHYRVMPLPGLAGRDTYAASFDEIGLVKSSVLVELERVAVLTPFGINLLQQRLIWYLTRFLAPTHLLNESCAAVFEEADLCEEWVVSRSEHHGSLDEANAEFHSWIREADSAGHTRQEGLIDPQRRAGIRRAMREALASL